jgi:LacI family transcriptional regulator
MTTAQIRKVALLVETALGYGRGLLRGIARYARLHGPWAFYLTPGDLLQALPKMEEWGGTGIIARVETPEVARAILATGLPVIALDLRQDQLSPDNPLSQISEVCPDSPKAGRMAAEHLLAKGFEQFAFVAAPGDPLWSTRRRDGFIERLAEAGLPCDEYLLPRSPRERQWSREQPRMVRWLQSLPKPVGLMACDDDRGRQVLTACREADLQVPEDVAVIGVDNDEVLCDVSDPPLSSVALDTEKAGYEAAALLDGLMSGRVRAPRRILVPPLFVVERRSTEVVALNDREVAMALRFIHDHAGQPISVKEVARDSQLSRRMLELRFRKAIGRTIHEEIQRVRLERAKRLLIETDLPMSDVAEAAGFAGASYFSKVFHCTMGYPPGDYRARTQAGAD